MSDFRPRSLSELRQRTEEIFDPNAGYLDVVGGINKLNSGVSNSLRDVNSDTTRSRMALPMSDVAKSGSQSFGSLQKQSSLAQPQEPDIATQYRNLSSADLDRVKGLDNQELQANINRIKQYQPLANNEANRALGMDLATKFPYHKYDTEADAFKSVTNNMLSPSRFASLASTQVKPMQYVSF